ncbi:hypothetical protein CFN78_24435 [Amycolatopsis antarctica]|uniref:Uncharacterized protein n=1 Tax=Amycolatopsis antarctica TaxID=1854586 RepID=A0A263CYS7_9PSEU|nr:hypothetical protein [Amycolatopsis antarctica]OZM70557.1 hypothetical protein CFN78_24435 [Amycolatopsis antarctica]
MDVPAPPKQIRQSPLMKVGVVLFAIGMVAVVAVFVMFAAGLENLPVWLSVAAGVITPLGLGLGLVGLVKEARRAHAAETAETTASPGASASGA